MLNITSANITVKPAENFICEDIEDIAKIITYVKILLILFALILIKSILMKTFVTCKKVYVVHNERVIRNHDGTNTQT